MFATTATHTTAPIAQTNPPTLIVRRNIEAIGCTIRGDADHSATCDLCGADNLARAIVLSVDEHRASLCPHCTAATLYGEDRRHALATRVWNRAKAIEVSRRSNFAHYSQRLTFWRSLLTAAESELADPNATGSAAVANLRAEYNARIATGAIETDLLIKVVAEYISDLEIVVGSYTLRPSATDIITA